MAAHIQIANAPCSWGALEFDLEGTVQGYAKVLDEIKETGYEGTELGDWGFMPTDPDALHKEIAARSLELIGAFVPVALAKETAHESGTEKALQVARLMYHAGYKNAFIVLADENGSVPERTKHAGRVTDAMKLSSSEMATFARGAEKVAAAVKDNYGMRTVFHHHCAGYIETPDEIAALMKSTSPELVGLCFDTGHLRFGGCKHPLEILDAYYDRIWHVHFKDFSPEVARQAFTGEWDYFESVKNGVFCELGKGDVDFDAVKTMLVKQGYKGWIVVEQDVLPGMGNPKLYAMNNRNYLRKIGL
jgi:inosose dehydratase